MKTRLKAVIGISLACAVILSFLFSIGYFSNINLKLTDSLYGGKPALDSVVIVAIDDKSLQEIGRWPWDREVFADTVDFLNESKTIGIDVAFFEASTKEQDEKLGNSLDRAGNVIIPVEYTTFENIDGKVIGKDMLLPVPEIRKAKGYGYINVITDKDGVTRAVNMDISGEYENFANVIYEEYWGKKSERRDKRFLVNFADMPGSFKYYSLSDLYHKRVGREEFKNKLVLIGATSPDMHDDYFVPTSKGKAMPGVEIHANTIQTLIKKDYLQEQSNWSVILLIFLTAIITTLIVSRFHILGAAITAAVMIIGYIFATILIFEQGVLMNIIYFPLTTAITSFSTISYMYLTEKKSKVKIVKAFNKYVSPAVLDEILLDPEKIKLGGVKKEITVFFSDIRGFTTISEGLTPEQLVHLLNEYLTAMTDIVMRHKGVVDKYIGDAIMSFWGAPLKQPDHAELACSTALDMIRDLKILREKWKKEGFPEIKIGIGLNTGHAVIGNMGSYERFDYTAMGDTINLGSRLEGLTKQYGVEIIISEFTNDKINKAFVTRKLDLVAVKGKKKPIFIYELVCRNEELNEKLKEKIKFYETGLELYLKKKFMAAAREFQKSNDFAAREFIKRCEEFKKNPPPKDWKGVWVMKTK